MQTKLPVNLIQVETLRFRFLICKSDAITTLIKLMLITPDHSPHQALTEVHDQLKRAALDKKHNFRFFSVATSGIADRPAQSRIVVLRSFRENWEFEFYTDHRSSKVEEIEQKPKLSALFWDPSKRVQVRIESEVTIHIQDEIARERWENVQGDAQKAYNSPVVPGSEISTAEEAHNWPEEFSDRYFSVIRCVAADVRILQISGLEHLAFSFQKNSRSQSWKGGRVAP